MMAINQNHTIVMSDVVRPLQMAGTTALLKSTINVN